MEIDTKNKIKKYYQNKYVAENYISERFVQPIYAFEHEKQVQVINDLIARHQLKKILEIAPGPARLTREIKSSGTALEYSSEMLELARKSMKGSAYEWKFVKGDAFRMNFSPKNFDLVFTFRFIRHFEEPQRKRLYSEIRKVLKPGGFLVFEALNRKKHSLIRKLVGKEKYFIYDALYELGEITAEVESSGFEVVEAKPVINHFFTQYAVSRLSSAARNKDLGKKIIKIIENFGGNPFGWVIVCRKK